MHCRIIGHYLNNQLRKIKIRLGKFTGAVMKYSGLFLEKEEGACRTPIIYARALLFLFEKQIRRTGHNARK